jgi:hypothetical protein
LSGTPLGDLLPCNGAGGTPAAPVVRRVLLGGRRDNTALLVTDGLQLDRPILTNNVCRKALFQAQADLVKRRGDDLLDEPQ